MSSAVVLDHRLFWNTKTFKMPTKVDANETDHVMGLNENDQEPGGTNKKYYVTDDQKPKENFTNTNVTDTDTDAEMGLNDDAILK